jgi:hypothetical protein
VTEDSVSMIYKALTAGAATGLLAVPRRRLGRVGTGLHRLVESEQGIDILHARARLPAWIAYLAWRTLRRPHFVTSVHGLYPVSRYSAVMTQGERVTAVSSEVKHYLQENYPLPAIARTSGRSIASLMWSSHCLADLSLLGG